MICSVENCNNGRETFQKAIWSAILFIYLFNDYLLNAYYV